ncbi:MAG: beta-phosphoglucomutase family hydrolase [Bacteroidales bacterium]|nr:beta-phosphoglucomutase family hydrolase [Bacteroidales bacterium]
MNNEKPIIPNNIEAIIFDLDGTLADSMPMHRKAWMNAIDKFDLNCPVHEMDQFAGLSTYKIAGEVLKRFNPNRSQPESMELAITKIEEFEKLHSQVQPIDLIVNVAIENFGILPMAVGTGGTRATASRTLELLELNKYFEVLVAAEDVENHKPEPDTFLKCARLLNVSPENCLVFEDGDRGVEAAKRAGMEVIDVRNYLS